MLKYIIAIGCVTSVSALYASDPPVAKDLVGRSANELVRQRFKDLQDNADAVVAARFRSVKAIESKEIDEDHIHHTLHSTFDLISTLRGKVADEFIVQHIKEQITPKERAVAITGRPIRYVFSEYPIVVQDINLKTKTILDEPVYFLYLKAVKGDKEKGEIYEVVEVNEWAGPGVFEAIQPWMKNYYDKAKDKK